jgi:hypothetical protein
VSCDRLQHRFRLAFLLRLFWGMLSVLIIKLMGVVGWVGYVCFREWRAPDGSCVYFRLLTTCDGKDEVCCVTDERVSMAASVFRCLGLALLRLFNCYLQGCGSMGSSIPFATFSCLGFLAPVGLRVERRDRFGEVLTTVVESLVAV